MSRGGRAGLYNKPKYHIEQPTQFELFGVNKLSFLKVVSMVLLDLWDLEMVRLIML